MGFVQVENGCNIDEEADFGKKVSAWVTKSTNGPIYNYLR